MIHSTQPPAIVAPASQCANNVSFKGDLKFLESHQIWKEFSELSKIYRESGHMEEVSKYIAKRMKSDGFRVRQIPNDGTVIATRGRGNKIIVQSHMDIVGVSADKNPRKPIEFHEKDGWLYGNDRTLGADDGIGAAAQLVIAHDPRFRKYPLQMIFTTNEEVGMDGAQLLKPEDFKGKYLINLDSEKEGVVTTGCAGIARFAVDEKIPTKTLDSGDYKKISVALTGARGAHSADINPESLNPITVLLKEIKGTNGAKIVKFNGGERFNSIPREAKTEILVHKNDAEAVTAALNEHLENLKKEKIANNPALSFEVKSEDAKAGTQYVEPEFQSKMLAALDSVPVGLFTKFEENGSTKTSQNFGILNIADGKIEAGIMGRSADFSEGADVESKTGAILSNLFGKEITAGDKSPIWQPRQESLLQDAAINAYADLNNGKKPIVKVEHGGLEGAIFAQTKPSLDIISIGPTMEEPHTIQERLKIDTVVPFYDWLGKIVQSLSTGNSSAK